MKSEDRLIHIPFELRDLKNEHRKISDDFGYSTHSFFRRSGRTSAMYEHAIKESRDKRVAIIFFNREMMANFIKEYKPNDNIDTFVVKSEVIEHGDYESLELMIIEKKYEHLFDIVLVDHYIYETVCPEIAASLYGEYF